MDVYLTPGEYATPCRAWESEKEEENVTDLTPPLVGGDVDGRNARCTVDKESELFLNTERSAQQSTREPYERAATRLETRSAKGSDVLHQVWEAKVPAVIRQVEKAHKKIST